MKMKAKRWYAYILFMLVGLLAGGMNIRAANIDDYFNSDYYYGYPEGNTGGNYGKDVNHSPLALINKLEIAGAKYYVKEVVYCLNEEVKPPSSEQTPFKSDGSYKNNFDVFLKLRGAREQLYKRKTPNRGNTDEEIKWVTKNSKDNGADTRKVLWNGYPVDAIGLKEKYGLSDMQFQAVTQAAIWYYTSDHGGITDKETLLNDYKKKFNNTNFQWTEASSRVYRILTGMDTSASLATPDANFEVYIYETTYPNNVQRLISVGIRGGASVKVTKKWIGSPADKITINILANGKKIRSQVLTAENKKGNDWVYQFTGLPQYDGKWQKIKYTVTEDSLSGYSSTIAGDATTGFVITNKRTKTYTNPKEGQLATTVSVKNNESTTPVRLLSKDTQGVEVTDTVSYNDLVGGKVYELTGTLMQIKADGSTEAIASASKEVTAEASGKGTWELTFAPQNLKAGEKYVVYEVAKSKENLVDSNKDDEPDTKQEVRHENPQDEAQTIVVSKPTRPRPTPPKPIVPKTVISKQNLGGEEIAGASIQIKDTTGKVVEAWVSQAGQSHQLTLPAGTYVFHEEAAPTGYLKVTDITFSVDDKGIVTVVQDTTTSHASKVENNRLVVVDEAAPTPPTPEEPEKPVTPLVPEKPEKPAVPEEPTTPKMNEVIISKQNLGGEEIAGASIQIKDMTGKVIEAWVSQAGQSHQLTLSAGTYVFHEEAAPTGYLKVTDITFSVDDKGIVTIVQDTTTSHASKVENSRLVVVDEAVPTPPTPEEPEKPVTPLVPEKPEQPTVPEEPTTSKMNEVIISKQNLGGEEIAGASIQIKDMTGKVIEAWVSQAGQSHQLTLSAGTYVFHEEAAPTGYLKVTDITFSVDDKGIVTIVQDTTTSHASKVENNRLVVVDEAAPTPPTPEEPEKPSRLPKTGQPEQPKNESSVEKPSNRQELPKTGSHYAIYSVFLGIVLEGTATYLLLRKLQRKGN